MAKSDEITLDKPFDADAVVRPARSRAGVLTLLVVASAAADTVFVAVAQEGVFPYPPLVFAYALIFSQVSLAAIWAGLVSRHLLLGALGLAMTYAIAIVPLNALHSNDGAWGRLLVVQMAAVALPLLAARAIGIRLSREVPYAAPDRFRLTRIQFTLRRLFAVTTSAAILLAFGRIIAQRLPPMQHCADLITFGGGFASIALLATWASLGVGSVRLQVVVLLAGSLAVSSLLVRMVPTSPENVLGIFCLVAGNCCLLAASLGVLRRHGYRLVRRAAADPPQPVHTA